MLNNLIKGSRIAYRNKNDTFDVSNLRFMDPIKEFDVWFNEACKCNEILEPNAMALATANLNGIPSVRYVLMKEYNENGFQFFTNCLSKKGKHMSENPVASAAFYWPQLNRQIRIEGSITCLPSEAADKYFNERPRESRISALVSECQSSVVHNREVLANRTEELIKKYSDESTIPRPHYWVGYNINPFSIEFWQGQSNRLHDRILFRKATANEVVDESLTMKGDGMWLIERLSP